jgi:tRNA A-37 threonylcarbamoyl transferase component Bud32
MNEGEIRWFAGASDIQLQLGDAASRAFRTDAVLHATQHRTIYRVLLNAPPLTPDASDSSDASSSNDTSGGTSSVVVKIHRLASGRHRFREWAKRLLGWSPARREWKALEALSDAGVAVPRPRAWGRLRNGDEIVVTDFLNGDSIANEKARADLVSAMASAIAKLHAAGFRHGDLHAGNLLSVEEQVFILDVQRAGRRRSERERLRDLACLELSLAKAGWSANKRQTLRDRLDVGDAFDAELRRFLRDHLRGRARRVLRVGRNWSRAQVGPFRGLRETSLAAESLAAIVAAAQDETRVEERRGGRVQMVEVNLAITAPANDDRTVLVKRIASARLKRSIGDRIRGTAAARAFYFGQASALLSNRAARPLAFLEERRFGFPKQSLLILEKVGDDDLDRVLANTPELANRLARPLGQWLAEGHAWGLAHRDMKASNIRVTIGADSIQFWMIDLEDLSFPTEISDDARLDGLSQLNASLDDDTMSIDTRLLALKAYVDRIPFAAGNEAPAKSIARRSLARAHRWRGDESACRTDASNSIESAGALETSAFREKDLSRNDSP